MEDVRGKTKVYQCSHDRMVIILLLQGFAQHQQCCKWLNHLLRRVNLRRKLNRSWRQGWRKWKQHLNNSKNQHRKLWDEALTQFCHTYIEQELVRLKKCQRWKRNYQNLKHGHGNFGKSQIACRLSGKNLTSWRIGMFWHQECRTRSSFNRSGSLDKNIVRNVFSLNDHTRSCFCHSC